MCERHQEWEKRPRPVAAILLGVIALYRMTLSSILGRGCRFLPTCSEYAGDAIRRHGAWRGSWLALGRILRCQPWGGEGFDPVPFTTQGQWWDVAAIMRSGKVQKQNPGSDDSRGSMI
jgi:putative membrane protein insertion efficiency factor